LSTSSPDGVHGNFLSYLERSVLGTAARPDRPKETGASNTSRKEIRVKKMRFVLSDLVFISEISHLAA
jgi:hypothetical protein